MQLLISVTDAEEARAALQGGADIIDVKEPNNGSLGRAPLPRITDVVRTVARRNPAILLSAAMGEAADICEPAAAPHEPSGVPDAQPHFLKLGLAGLAGCDWRKQWQHARRILDALFPAARWVAVAYADHQRAQSPDPHQVAEAAVGLQLPVLLLDTFSKDGTTLMDWLPESRLADLRDVTRQAGMLLALAGRISLPQLPDLACLEPDIVAVRGAACADGQRTGAISRTRVRELKRELSRLLPAP